jgi:hypothetical protein
MGGIWVLVELGSLNGSLGHEDTKARRGTKVARHCEKLARDLWMGSFEANFRAIVGRLTNDKLERFNRGGAEIF